MKNNSYPIRLIISYFFFFLSVFCLPSLISDFFTDPVVLNWIGPSKDGINTLWTSVPLLTNGLLLFLFLSNFVTFGLYIVRDIQIRTIAKRLTESKKKDDSISS